MKISRHVLLPVVIAGALLVGGVAMVSASQAPADSIGAVPAQQEAKAADPSAVCVRVAAATKPHPVLKELCGLYGDASLSATAHDSVGKVIMQLVRRRHHHVKLAGTSAAAPTTTATATPAH